MNQPGQVDGRAQNRLLAFLATLAALFALKLTKPVTLPIVAGLLAAALAWPIVRRLRRGVPEPVAVAVAFFTVVLTVVAFGAALWWAGSAVAERAPEYGEQLQQLRQRLQRAAERAGVPFPALPGGEGAASGGGGSGGSGSAGRIATRVLSAVYTSLGALVLTLAFCALALAEASDERRKIARRLAGRGAETLLAVAGEIAHAFRQYAAVKTLTSVIAGVASGLLSLAFGLDFAFVWALLAFLLEYVPTLGSLLAVLPPTLFALVQFDGSARPLWVFLAFGAMQIVLGNFVDPKIEGRYLALSPFMVLLAIVLWTWVWGAPGALLGVPLTLAAVITCAHFEQTRWVAALVTEPRDGKRRETDDAPA